MDYSKIADQYDSLYATSDDYIYNGGNPMKSVESVLAIKTTGRVLDVGGGDGRNAMFFARKGFDVTATDLSRVGLEKLERYANTEDLHIATVVTDSTKDVVLGMFDVILISNMLHHINIDDVQSMIATLKEQTNTGGLHVIDTFMNQGDLFKRNEFKNRFYPSEKELQQLYDGWMVKDVRTKEITARAKAKDGTNLQNWVVSMVVQKP